MEERAAKLMEILKNEYGISSQSELSAALKRLGTLDISVFCLKGSDEVKNEEKRGYRGRPRRT